MKSEINYTKLTKLGTFRNNWRERIVTLYEHPTDANMVISVGESVHKDQMGRATEFVCEERRGDYQRQLVRGDWSTYN